MATIKVEASSLTTAELRRALIAHRRAIQPERFVAGGPDLGDPPTSCLTNDCRAANGGAFVAVDGSAWNFHSVGLNATQAAAVIAAIDGSTPEF